MPNTTHEPTELMANPAPDDSAMSTSDLAELMSAFTEVTTKLERTHGQLRSEVGRLSTELRQANEALQRSRRLAALGEMAAGISHEIRNPLGSIRLYANMLVDDLADMPEQCEIVQKIGRAVRGLDEIVGDVLTFAREMKTSWHPCDTSAMIDYALELCCAETGESTIVRDDLDADSFELMCDPTLIQQALVNVLRNAGEANRVSGGHRITISVNSCKIESGDHLADGIMISLRDEGDGIPAQVIERMFNPFFTTRATGTGLGLAIVHRIIDAHRGKVEVKNNNAGANDEYRGACVELHI
ncbi:MAG: hypothetical protein JKX70_10335, partial [Phycisphaerales bacterium]|nr:hypothetical protein [Phycisphaerales bacterium]